MIHFFEVLVFVGYSFLSPMITAGGSMIVTNTLSFGEINLIKSAGLSSSFFLINCIISTYVFRGEIVWQEVKNLLPITIIGSFIGSFFLVNINPVILLSLMFIFSVYYIYKKIYILDTKIIQKDSLWREQIIGLFAGAVTGAALPGGGFLNSYFASKGFTLTQMFATLGFLLIPVLAVKISVMIESNLLIPSDFIGLAISIPLLIGSNIIVRQGLISLPKSTTDKITIFAMSIFSLYALMVIIKSVL